MNTSFSPPPSRWDYHFQTEGLRYGSNDSLQLFDSSTSSNSNKGSRSWVRGMYHNGHGHHHRYPASDVTVLDCSSPSESALIQPWTPPPRQGIGTDDLEITAKRETMSGPIFFTPTMEGSSITRDARGSTSSRSDGSDFERTIKLRRRSFMSKPVHPLSISRQNFHENTQRTSSGSSSMDLTDFAEQFESEYNVPTEGFKCGLCERFLSQRSPYSSRRIVRSKDMPVTGVLSCKHVFHAECLDQSTPKAQKNDPNCPLCSNPDEPQASIEDAVRGSNRSSMLFLGRNRMKKNLSLKGNNGKEFPGKLRKIGSHPLQLLGGKFIDQAASGSKR